ncbi:MAG: hypothetical protein LBN39_07910 [Planctomycetaceae bacterium]|jgi:hypothetical protein|nr:hypothetical protein [Planctomycetaceae bacterium]
MPKLAHPLRVLALQLGFALIAAAPLFAAKPSIPQLVPAFPDATLQEEPQYEPEEPLPLPVQKRTVKRSSATQVSINVPPNRDEIIVPQGFLGGGEEDEPAPLETPPLTKPQTRKKTSKTIETAEGITPPPDYSGYFVNIPKPESSKQAMPKPLPAKQVPAGIILNEGEFLVADAGEPIAANAPNASTLVPPGGVFSEVLPSFAAPSVDNPALASSYGSPMIIKTFGSGALDNLTLFGGASGFKSETDFGAGTNGSFGFSEGFNWSGPATPQETVCAQFGFRAVQSNVCGNTTSHKNSRGQCFVTAGVFKRFSAYPLQGGAVVDYLDDDLLGKTKTYQGRCELSVRTFRNLEYGFLGTTGLSKQSNAAANLRGNLFYGTVDNIYAFKAQQSYQIFIRKHFAFNGSAEVRAGATDRGDTVLSASGEFPVSDRLSFNGGFSALIPEEGHGYNGSKRESWAVSFGAVFYFRGGATTKESNPYRPMFDVAGNGTFYNRIVRK